MSHHYVVETASQRRARKGAVLRNERFPCGDCGQMVTASESHTWEDCRAYESAEHPEASE